MSLQNLITWIAKTKNTKATYTKNWYWTKVIGIHVNYIYTYMYKSCSDGV